MVVCAHEWLGALMHHFAKDGARRLTGRLSPITLPAPYSIRCIPLIASRTLSTRNKVNDKDATCYTFRRTSVREHDSLRRVCVCVYIYIYARGETRKVNTPVKEKEEEREKKRRKNRVGPKSKAARRPDIAMERDRSDPRSIRAKSYINTPHRARQKKISRRDDARFQSRQPRPTSDGFSNAELAIKTHCQRQRLPHPSDRRWKACQEAAPIYPQCLRHSGWRKGGGVHSMLYTLSPPLPSPCSALAQKCIFQAWYWRTDN